MSPVHVTINSTRTHHRAPLYTLRRRVGRVYEILWYRDICLSVHWRYARHFRSFRFWFGSEIITLDLKEINFTFVDFNCAECRIIIDSQSGLTGCGCSIIYSKLSNRRQQEGLFVTPAYLILQSDVQPLSF